jgi:hypothetical protein
VMQKVNAPTRWQNRPKVGFYQHFRPWTRAFVAAGQHRPTGVRKRARAVE